MKKIFVEVINFSQYRNTFMKDILKGICLYRGDCNKNKDMANKLKHSYDCLFTKLAEGGNPLEIYKPLSELINKHVDYHWDKSHCLSFTEQRKKAVEYATYPDNLKEEELMPSERLEDWEFVIATLPVCELNPIECDTVPGIYTCNYECHRALLIDLQVAIRYIEWITANTKEFSTRDWEWLIVPLDPMDIGYSACFYLPYSGHIDYYTR